MGECVGSNLSAERDTESERFQVGVGPVGSQGNLVLSMAWHLLLDLFLSIKRIAGCVST